MYHRDVTSAPPLWRPDRPRSGRTESAALPTDLVADASRRLVTGMLVIAAISAVYMVLFATAWRDRWETVGASGNIILLSSSLVLAVLARRTRGQQRALIRIGLGYEVLLCLTLSVIEFNGELIELDRIGAGQLISWTAVVIAFFPVMCPAPRRTTLLAALTAAAMGPVGWAIASATTGRWVLDPGWLLGRWLPPYALGCAAYYALTRSLVFSEATPMKTAVAHVTKQVEPPSIRGGVAIPAELERLVMDCLAKDRNDRPASAAEVGRRLAAIPLAQPWTAERADVWWQSHLDTAAPTPEAAAPAAFAATIASDRDAARGGV